MMEWHGRVRSCVNSHVQCLYVEFGSQRELALTCDSWTGAVPLYMTNRHMVLLWKMAVFSRTVRSCLGQYARSLEGVVGKNAGRGTSPYFKLQQARLLVARASHRARGSEPK